MESTSPITDRGVGDLDDFDAFREKRFNFLYLCEKCARSFDSVLAMDSCKFCSSPLKQLSAKQKHPLIGEGYFRYYCSKCEKNFLSPVKHDECQICGFRIIHFYKWDDMPLKDKLAVKLFKLASVKKAADGKEPVPEKAEEKPEGKENGVKLPDFSKILEKFKAAIPEKALEKPARPEEELPTF
ncbi:MAG TPA: hypothetical protein VI979_01535 [archaeon]|nr:hypothetical protein [Candidatus Aenigmarchaeota archaeon]HLD83518.1 hypothetical protein [archaeon]